MSHDQLKAFGCTLCGILIVLISFMSGCRQSMGQLSEIIESSTQTFEANDTQIANNFQLTITPLDAENLLETRINVLIIDVRLSSSYEISHINGAISIPVTELENRLVEIPKDGQILVYAQCH